jgi:CBS domain-containing protein
MIVRDFMTSIIITAEVSMSLSEAVKLMAAEDIGSLIVTRGDVLEGLVTSRDIICAQLISPEVYSTMTLEDVMTSPVVSVSGDADLGQVIAIMSKTGKKYLPVMQGNEVIGIVTATDVIRVLATVKGIADALPDEDY